MQKVNTSFNSYNDVTAYLFYSNHANNITHIITELYNSIYHLFNTDYWNKAVLKLGK